MADVSPGVLDGSLLGLAHPVLDLGEGLLDRMRSGEYGGRYQSLAPAALIIWRMAAALWEPRLSLTTMSPGSSTGTSCCLDIGAEALAIDRPVEHARCRQPVAAQRAEEGQRAPVAVRGVAAQACRMVPSGRAAPCWS